jgi:hypothetical protein
VHSILANHPELVRTEVRRLESGERDAIGAIAETRDFQADVVASSSRHFEGCLTRCVVFHVVLTSRLLERADRAV